jgi:hypothetical protein
LRFSRNVSAAARSAVHQLKDEFSPQRLYYWIETLFADYRKADQAGPVLTSHMFRKRAFTKAWQAGIDPRRDRIRLQRRYADEPLRRDGRTGGDRRRVRANERNEGLGLAIV